MNFTSSPVYHSSVTMAQGYCINMVHIFYIHTSIKDLEMNHSVQYDAEARDPVIIYSWCVLTCLAIIITTYVHGGLQRVTVRVWQKGEWAGEDWFCVGINTLLSSLFVACWCQERGYFRATYFLSHSIHHRLTLWNMLPKTSVKILCVVCCKLMLD